MIETTSREQLTTYVLSGSIDDVFARWTSAEHLKEWWGPYGFQNTTCSVAATEGGGFEVTGHTSAGESIRAIAVYREIDIPRWIVFSQLIYRNDELVHNGLVTATFHEQGSVTKVRIHCESELDANNYAAWWTLAATRLDALVRRSGPNTKLEPLSGELREFRTC